MAGLMAQSVVAKHSMVAMLGWIMPLPLEMPPTFTVLPPISTSAAASLGRVSVVMMAVAAAWGALGAQGFHQLRDARWDGLHGQHLADDAGGGHHHVLGLDAQGLGGQIAHGLGFLHTVSVAGVGVAGVADDSLGGAVRDVLPGDQDGRALYQVLGVHGGCRARAFRCKSWPGRALDLFLRIPQWMPPATKPWAAVTPPSIIFIGGFPSLYLIYVVPLFRRPEGQ